MKNIEFNIQGLKCDNQNCNWEDMSISLEQYHDFVDTNCPKCDSPILPKEQYKSIQQLLNAAEIVNSMDLSNLTIEGDETEALNFLEEYIGCKINKICSTEKSQ